MKLRDQSRIANVSQSERGITCLAVLHLARFEGLRRQLGYRSCARIVAEVVDLALSRLRESEVGRVGDETVEFVFSATDHRDAETQLDELIRTLAEPIHVDGLELHLAVAIGATIMSRSCSASAAHSRAASALAQCFSRRARLTLLTAAQEVEPGFADVELIRDFGRSVRNGEIEFHYQPKMHARTCDIHSVEALARWTHPQHGRINPDLFVRIAEETGAIRVLSELSLARAIEDRRRLTTADNPLPVYVNVSGQLVSDRSFARHVADLGTANPGAIGVEITETAVIQDPEGALQNLRLWSEAGVKIAIDDYGSGLSSLAYLKQLPAGELKIDKSFILGLTTSHRDPLLVRSTIDLAHALEMEVTAEGVEDALALALLSVMGCDLLQGFHIARPMPIDALIDYCSCQAERARRETLSSVVPSLQRAAQPKAASA